MVIWFFCLLISSLAGIPYASLMSLVVGLGNIVPVLGPLAAGIFCCLILLVLNPFKALVFAVILLVLQQADSKILSPLILGDATGLKTFWMLVAILAGGLFMTAGFLLTPWILSAMHTTPEAMSGAVLYLRIYFLGMIPNVIYNMGTGILRAVGDSRRP